MMVVTPLTFLGGSFYSISMLPPVWQKITLFNPVVYLVNGFRWSFYGVSDVNVVLSFGMTLGFMLLCLGGHPLDVPHRATSSRTEKRAVRSLHQPGPPRLIFFGTERGFVGERSSERCTCRCE